MPVQAVRAEIEILHEGEMARGHFAIFRVAGELEGFAQYWNRHENAVAHSIARTHGLLHFPGFGKPNARCVLHHLKVTRVTRSLRKLGKHEIAGKIAGHGPAGSTGFRT